MDAAVRRIELQAIPWMDQPAFAPVGSVFCEHSPWVANCQGADMGIFLRDAAQQGCCDTALRARAYMDVFTAILKKASDDHTVRR